MVYSESDRGRGSQVQIRNEVILGKVVILKAKAKAMDY